MQLPPQDNMMKCAVGWVNKMAFLTEEDNALELHQVEWLSSLIVFLICSPFCRLMSLRRQTTELAAVLTHREETGISACLHSFQYVQKSKREKGSLIKRRVSNALSGREEIFLMKCNTLPNCAAASGARYTFQRKICMNFKCSISQLRPDPSERKGRRDQSLWWCVKRASSSPSMYFSSLPFIWQLSIFHLIQNKQLEYRVMIFSRLWPQWNLRFLIRAYL